MKLSAIFLTITTATTNSSRLDPNDIVGYLLAVAGIWATWYFYNKEQHTRLSCEILMYAYKFSLYYRDLIGRVNSNTWYKGKKGNDIQSEIRVLCAEANPFLPKLNHLQRQSLENKLKRVTDYLSSFVSGTDESKEEMLNRMNDVDKYLQQLAEETK